jgi:UDP-glucuronate decarboxylase
MMSGSLSHRRVEVVAEEEKYAPKGQKQWAVAKPVEYVLREQRLLFILVGVAVTSLFFVFLQPVARGPGRTDAGAVQVYGEGGAFGTERAVESAPYRQRRAAAVNFGGKIPLGLQRRALRIVVTGGAGFVGSHLVDRLIERGDSVIVVDNFFTGRKENVMHHFGNPRFELIRHDVVEPLLLEVDQIYHLACPASPVHYKFNPIKTIISLS